MEKRSYNFLLRYYLESEVNGIGKVINKTYFPKNYYDMMKELEILNSQEFIYEENLTLR